MLVTTRLGAAIAASVMFAGSTAGAAPSVEAAGAVAATVEAGPVHRFRIGSLDAVALLDGGASVPNDGKIFGVGRPAGEVKAVLDKAGLPGDMLHLSFQPLLVRSGNRVLLFDTGAGNAFLAQAGHIQAALKSAGVDAGQVTDIFISHAHADHVGGLLDGGGALAFPNAAVRMSAPEWESMKASPQAAAIVAAVTPKIVPFAPGAEDILPGISAVAVNGHSPGHSAYLIASGTDRLLYIGDSAHHSVISVQRADWTIAFDGDEPVARASRRDLLARAADEDLRIYAFHFPFPGLGHVRRSGDGFKWVSE